MVRCTGSVTHLVGCVFPPPTYATETEAREARASGRDIFALSEADVRKTNFVDAPVCAWHDDGTDGTPDTTCGKVVDAWRGSDGATYVHMEITGDQSWAHAVEVELGVYKALSAGTKEYKDVYPDGREAYGWSVEHVALCNQPRRPGTLIWKRGDIETYIADSKSRPFAEVLAMATDAASIPADEAMEGVPGMKKSDLLADMPHLEDVPVDKRAAMVKNFYAKMKAVQDFAAADKAKAGRDKTAEAAPAAEAAMDTASEAATAGATETSEADAPARSEEKRAAKKEYDAKRYRERLAREREAEERRAAAEDRIRSLEEQMAKQKVAHEQAMKKAARENRTQREELMRGRLHNWKRLLDETHGPDGAEKAEAEFTEAINDIVDMEPAKAERQVQRLVHASRMGRSRDMQAGHDRERHGPPSGAFRDPGMDYRGQVPAARPRYTAAEIAEKRAAAMRAHQEVLNIVQRHQDAPIMTPEDGGGEWYKKEYTGPAYSHPLRGLQMSSHGVQYGYDE